MGAAEATPDMKLKALEERIGMERKELFAMASLSKACTSLLKSCVYTCVYMYIYMCIDMYRRIDRWIHR